jgi:hypothetical protein
MSRKPDEQAVCARCGSAIDLADSYVVQAADGTQTASLCRTEHLVAWVMRGAQWQLERPWEVDAADRSAAGPVKLLRRRAGTLRELEFDDVEELRKWASAGGFWASGSDQQPC